jgi:hypothetical protein
MECPVVLSHPCRHYTGLSISRMQIYWSTVDWRIFMIVVVVYWVAMIYIAPTDSSG